ncbi:hypothetical protein GCM10009612_78080 [Streptomyces beijiangensis]
MHVLLTDAGETVAASAAPLKTRVVAAVSEATASIWASLRMTLLRCGVVGVAEVLRTDVIVLMSDEHVRKIRELARSQGAGTCLSRIAR